MVLSLGRSTNANGVRISFDALAANAVCDCFEILVRLWNDRFGIILVDSLVVTFVKKNFGGRLVAAAALRIV